MQFPQFKYDFDFSLADIGDHIKIAFRDEGEGENTLLFIHGLSSYIPAWNKIFPELSKKFRCVAIDLPGYGKSSQGIFSGSVNYYNNVILRFIKKMKLENVTLVGHSMGGHLAMSSALAFPAVIKTLILIAPAGLETFSAKEKELIIENSQPDFYFSAGDEQIVNAFKSNFFNMPDDVYSMIEDRIKMREYPNFHDYCQIITNSLKGLLQEPVYKSLHKIKQPTLILFGRNDKWIPNRYLHKELTTEDIANIGGNLIPNSKVVMIDNCGHFIPFESPKTLITEIKYFLT
ncbi:MAG: alpha/beta hydrolase [Melioribacteraceae bacterium]|nr:alpha/beta hydrolase [Melioribacteraceae bacterium]